MTSRPFQVVCEIEPPTKPDLMHVRHQIGTLSKVANRFLIPDNHIGRATVSSVAVAHEVQAMGGRSIACLNSRDRNMLGFRFVLLSYVDAVATSPQLQTFETALARKRRQRHQRMLMALIQGGYLDRRAQARSDVLYEQGSMISSGWLAAAALRGISDEAAVLHFAKLGCALLEPHCTTRGKRQMRQILKCAHDGG